MALLHLRRIAEDYEDAFDQNEWLRMLTVSPAYVHNTHRFLFAREDSTFMWLREAVQADVKEQVQAQLRVVAAEQAELRRCERLAETIGDLMPPSMLLAEGARIIKTF
jgi:dTDP-4-amino-4,6-dideoxygalactose transaminase